MSYPERPKRNCRRCGDGQKRDFRLDRVNDVVLQTQDVSRQGPPLEFVALFGVARHVTWRCGG